MEQVEGFAPAFLPVTETPDDRSPLARALEWASVATTVSAEMVVPLFLGYWVDQRLGTKAVFALLGGAAGLSVGIWSLIRLTKVLESGPRDKSRKE